MASKALKTPDDLQRWVHFLRGQDFPMTVSQTKGVMRSKQQNKTINMWYAQAAAELGDTTAEDVRAECKLQFGVPILRRDDAVFKAEYDEAFKPLPYEQKRRLFKALEPAVTSRMVVKQLTEFMAEMRMHFDNAGVRLIDPDDLKYAEENA